MPAHVLGLRVPRALGPESECYYVQLEGNPRGSLSTILTKTPSWSNAIDVQVSCLGGEGCNGGGAQEGDPGKISDEPSDSQGLGA